ncbi:MAG: hypothetical protein OXH75_28605 [Acidobacteria bacterium]|nr:hypothetical protein [Acidobacteriota bacterium]
MLELQRDGDGGHLAAADLDAVARLAGRVPLAYTMSLATITIAEGKTVGTATITVTDDAEDDDETIVLGAESVNPGPHRAAADPSSHSGGWAAPRCASSLPAWKNAP